MLIHHLHVDGISTGFIWVGVFCAVPSFAARLRSFLHGMVAVRVEVHPPVLVLQGRPDGVRINTKMCRPLLWGAARNNTMGDFRATYCPCSHLEVYVRLFAVETRILPLIRTLFLPSRPPRKCQEVDGHDGKRLWSKREQQLVR